MKKTLFAAIIIPFILAGCSQQCPEFPQGAWNLVQVINVENGTSTVVFPGQYTGTQMKVWTEKNWIFVGENIQDTIKADLYGGGTYTLEGNKYNETIVWHGAKMYIGKTLTMTLELKNDTLVQTYHPADSAGNPVQSISTVEKYIKIK